MPYWSQEQESILADMIKQGKTVEEIATTLGKSVEALAMKVRRMGFVLPQEGKVTVSSTTTMLEPILPAKDMLSLQEMMQILLGALDRLRSGEGISSQELRRYRLIVSTARTYMAMLERFHNWTKIEQSMVDMAARFIERYKHELAGETDAARRSFLENQIKLLEEQVNESKQYKPFEKKPSLLSPI